MPQPRKLTDEQEAAALALNRSGLSVSECARTYNLTWQGMKNCLDRARSREPGFQRSTGNLETSDAT